MSLKARLRVSIVALVAFVVIAVSALYLYDFAGVAFEDASERAQLIAEEVNGYVQERFDQTLSQQPRTTFEEIKPLWYQVVRQDRYIDRMLQRARGHNYMVVNITISAADGSILAASDSSFDTLRLSRLANFDDWRKRPRLPALWELLTGDANYAVALPLGFKPLKPIVTTTVVVRSSFIRHSLDPAIRNFALAFGVSFLVSVLLALMVPHLVLQPLERVSTQIDLIRLGQFTDPPPPAHEAREFAVVQSKLNLLGQQYRGAREDAIELRGSIERLLQGLDEAVMMFDDRDRLVMAGKPVERLLGCQRDELLGRSIDDLFPTGSPLGDLISSAVRRQQPIRDRLVSFEQESRPRTLLLVSVETMQGAPGANPPGTLVTLRDAETRRQLEAKLDLSSRLAAISRLMGGVAHEIKNPLNSMAVHLEVLKSKLAAGEPEIEVIAAEIRRLDRVVKTFLNFNRPLELQLRDFDLTGLARQTVALIAPAAREKNIHIESHLDESLLIRGDPDLLGQAILNVVLNGIEAMNEGGRLMLKSESRAGECVLTIADDGPGIPPDVQDKIFNLYFTTKKGGSGVGLALTFRMVQLHNGTIDFVTSQDTGTSFRMRFPEAVVALEASASTESNVVRV